jgi:hypothetical protein
MLLHSESTSRFCTSRRLCTEFKTVNFKSLASIRTTWYSVRTLICQASSVRMMRTFCPDSLLCPKASNCSRLHTSGRVSATHQNDLQCSTSKRISFQNTDMGRQLQPSGWCSVPVRTLSLIRQVVQKTFNRPDVSLHCPDTQTLLWKLFAAEVQSFGF